MNTMAPLLMAAPPFDPGSAGLNLLGVLAWAVSAAGVGGLIVIGTQMAMQLRRGEMGEGATYFRGVVIILGACILGSTAGPIVSFLGPFGL
ncbi:hypothetical protein ACIBL8_38390 [Streptomyces sp. NPDC050523]|uniref:hypothetical protein n=1 Tax=Streptomyces sp. NPDC050523 TaxID=3365622 RepID=UPI0037877BA0